MIDLLADSPLLLFFLVAAAGTLLGEVRILGLRLGTAGVMFAGLAAGALDPALKLPEFTWLLGLVLFVYTIGLASGPAFFAGMRSGGLGRNLLVVGMLCLGAGGAALAGWLLGLSPRLVAGIFAGAFTNTPALAHVLNRLEGAGDAALAAPVGGYALTYPIGVLGMLAALSIARRAWKPAPRAADEPAPAALVTRTFRVTRADGQAVAPLVRSRGWRAVFGRVRRGDDVRIVDAQTRFADGDVVTVTAAPTDADTIVAALGEPVEERLTADRSQFDFRRVFVSNPEVAGKALRDLYLLPRFEALATRVRRGDVDLVPTGATVLQPGDRVRVLCPREQMDRVSRFFGDSYRAVAEVDVLSFGLGAALGLLLGAVPVPLPGGGTFALGMAGGPLVAGLVLGRVGRTGPFLWNIPYAANLSLRQLGIVLFLAGVGTRSGEVFAAQVGEGGLLVIAVGAALTCTVAVMTLWVGHALLKLPFSSLSGLLAGLQTQPAVLTFAVEQSGDDQPNVAYATVYPAAILAKILLAQLLLG